MLPFNAFFGSHVAGARLLIALSLLLSVNAAHADGATAAAMPENKARAKELYEQAKINYRAGDLEKAAAEFKESFKLYPRPETLFNLAQTHRLLKNYEKAIFFYQQYLSVATNDIDNNARRTIRERIDELQNLVKQQQAAQNAPPQGPEPSSLNDHTPTRTTLQQPTTAAAPAAATIAIVPQRPQHHYGRAAVALGFVGVIVVGAGAGLLGYASTLQPTPGATLGDVQSQADERRSLRISGGVLVGAGAGALIGSAVYLGFYLKGRHQ